jgi:tetratricopeptide (TPR) repeat protein
MLAQWFAQLGRTTDSIRVSTELEKLSVNKPELAFNLAVVYWSQMRYDDAWILANKSCRLNPSDPMVHVLAGKAALQLGRFEEAVGKALDALEITQAFPEAHALLGMALSWYGDLESALQSFENAKVYHECPLVAIMFMSFLFQLKGQSQIASDYWFDYTMRSEAEGSATEELKGPYGPLAFAAKHGLIMQ